MENTNLRTELEAKGMSTQGFTAAVFFVGQIGVGELPLTADLTEVGPLLRAKGFGAKDLSRLRVELRVAMGGYPEPAQAQAQTHTGLPPIKLYLYATAPGVASLTSNWDELGVAARVQLTRAATAEDIQFGQQYEGMALYRTEAGNWRQMEADSFVEASAEGIAERLRASGFAVELHRNGHI